MRNLGVMAAALLAACGGEEAHPTVGTWVLEHNREPCGGVEQITVEISVDDRSDPPVLAVLAPHAVDFEGTEWAGMPNVDEIGDPLTAVRLDFERALRFRVYVRADGDPEAAVEFRDLAGQCSAYVPDATVVAFFPGE